MSVIYIEHPPHSMSVDHLFIVTLCCCYKVILNYLKLKVYYGVLFCYEGLTIFMQNKCAYVLCFVMPDIPCQKLT